MEIQLNNLSHIIIKQIKVLNLIVKLGFGDFAEIITFQRSRPRKQVPYLGLLDALIL